MSVLAHLIVLVIYSAVLGAAIVLALRRRAAGAEACLHAHYPDLLLHGTGDVIFSLDQTLRYTYISPAVTRLAGFECAELIGQPARATLALQDQAVVVKGLLEDLAGDGADAGQGPACHCLEAQIVGKDGGARWVEMRTVVLRDDHNRPAGLVGVMRDIGQQRAALRQVIAEQRAAAAREERESAVREVQARTQQVLRFAAEQAERAGELIAEGEFSTASAYLMQLGAVAHEAVMDFSATGQAPASEGEGFFAAVRAYLDQFSKMSGIQTLLSLPPDGAEDLLSPQAEILLLQIIRGALANARACPQTRAFHIIFTRAGERVQVVITDDGAGFDPARLSTDAEMGAGPGSLAERCAALGGEFEVRSAPGQGTQVLVELPLAGTHAGDLQSARVLLADDHPLILSGLEKVLTSYGMQVVATERSGQEAVKRACEVKPDVVLIDMHMPGMTGAEAARNIKAELPETRVAVLSVSADDQDVLEAMRNGANGYLLKSQSSEQFMDQLTRLIRGESILSPEIAQRLLAYGQRPAAANGQAEARLLAAGLTAQQIEVLRRVAQGLEYKEIALEMHISPHTVKYHFNQALSRLRLTGRSDALAYALQIGLIADHNVPVLAPAS